MKYLLLCVFLVGCVGEVSEPCEHNPSTSPDAASVALDAGKEASSTCETLVTCTHADGNKYTVVCCNASVQCCLESVDAGRE